ncbi:MAG: molybdenum cofactor guanylyltransferase [Isosphaeraceae bacterium]|nr:molybdenum cofactor guanylyltransferase [Isosphaeraceae bacterium]
MSLGAVVLCGGRSQRMGRPKAWLPFGPEVLLQRVVRILGTIVDSVVVVAAPGQDVPPLPDSVLLTTDPVEARGPLQGLAAGMSRLPSSVELAYATATDVPFLESAWIGRLVELIGDHDLALPWVGGYHHPLAALYRPAAALPAIESLLRDDRLRPVFLVDKVGTRVVVEDELRGVDPGFRTLRNLNTPDEYQVALREAGFSPDAEPLRGA